MKDFYIQDYMIAKINSVNNFYAPLDEEELEEFDIAYKNVPLHYTDIGYPPIMPRQLGYDLEVKDIYKAGIEFESAEGMKETDGYVGPYCNNFYFFTKAISPNRVQVTIRYLGPPENKEIWDINIYNDSIRRKVELNSCYKLVNDPFYDKLEEMGIPHDKNIIRPLENNSFHFQTEFDAETYGDVMLKVDQIIHDLEN